MPRIRPLALMTAAALALGAPAGRAETRDHITVSGSSTVYPFATAVAESFGRQGRWRTPVVESTGTGGGFKLFCGGVGIDTPDLNDASRPITESERATCRKNGVGAIEEIRIGYDGIVIASSKRASAFDLTRAELYRAVAKSVPVGGRLVPNPYRRWSDVDPKLPARPISVLGPAPNHGTRDAFVELVMEPSCGQAPEVRALAPDARKRACEAVREDGAWVDVSGDYAVLMGKLTNDPAAVGIFTFAYLDQNRDKIQAARIDGVAPALETIGSSRYPISRPLFLYVKTAHIAAVPGLAEFVLEFVSDKAAGREGYLADRGLTPLPKAELDAERAKARALAALKR